VYVCVSDLGARARTRVWGPGRASPADDSSAETGCGCLSCRQEGGEEERRRGRGRRGWAVLAGQACLADVVPADGRLSFCGCAAGPAGVRKSPPNPRRTAGGGGGHGGGDGPAAAGGAWDCLHEALVKHLSNTGHRPVLGYPGDCSRLLM
jgi:hypothetical protein